MTHANPFHLLGLATDADNDTIVRTGEDLSATAETDSERERYAWAVRELLGDTTSARLHRLLEAPGANYHADRWDDFARRHRRPPMDAASLGSEPVAPAALHTDEVVGLVLEAMSDPPAPDMVEVALHAPYGSERGPSPLGVADVLFG